VSWKQEYLWRLNIYNTRIQGLYNQFNVDILISNNLLKKLELYPLFQAKSLGENQPRGRGEKVELFSVT
jgi:adenylate cyclase